MQELFFEGLSKDLKKIQLLDRNPNTLKYKATDKRVLWAKISCSSCDPALSVHDNVNHHQDSTRDQHVNTSLDQAFYDWATTGIPVITF